MEFNLHSLEIFTTLCKVKNFTKTASLLGMTQPGVSQHVKSLEEYFGINLINRFGKSFELTSEGQKVLSYGSKLFSEHKLFKDELGLDSETSGACKISAPGSIGIKLYTLLLNLNKLHPKLHQIFFYAPNLSIENQLLADELDLGVMSVKPKSDLLYFTKLTTEKLLLIVPKGRKVSNFSDLQKLGFINHPDGKDMATKVLAENFKEFKSFDSLNIYGANNQINRILEPVCMGLGFTILPHYAYEEFKNKNKLEIIKLKKNVFNDIYLVRKKHRPLPKRYGYIEDYLIESF